ncbi:two-component system, chemotaxis family, response regulator CheB [Variovorax sp. OK605]|jgi:two-component system chemotaxis response regulator CheB|uniref:chemotaxis protein CheB n=1 Tax=unclassified Variovorax TaxID=663243 RepID=UPI0008CE0F9A|nr:MULTISPECIES: chemotaxis protein CheB [unclassified Variovorax]SEJ74236.1 two-component system, chemotaxis family, response regulator CheB [Variovorax sp. OK202]SFC86663.1 two-component system, chemotaxis family, response regulator CheB [Variovorax sp. OK212]SFO56675.1 two-component system, chemotaxis family, response regulator CheB [Variovorax sp. OK605]
MKRQLRSSVNKHVDAVVLGASAGGIDALTVLLNDLPATWQLPMAVVLHLPEDHESHLAEIFAQRMPIPVHEAADKMPLAAGSLYFAPPGYHLSIERERRFSLSCEPPVLFSRPSIDVLMGSAADAYGPAVAGFLLTGANDDGAEGLNRIHLAGGLTAVQEPKEAQIPTMPQAAIARHVPDYVLPLRDLRALLLQLEAAHAH